MTASQKPSRRPHLPTPGPSRLWAIAVAAVLLVGLAACEPASGPERVSAMRAGYEATLNSFTLRETPMLEESGMVAEGQVGEEDAEGEEGAAAADEAADTAGAEGEEVSLEGDMIVEEVPMQQDVILDVVLRKTQGGGRLDGITLDVSQVDAEENDKATYRIWVETSTLRKGSRQAIAPVLEDVDVAPDDKFAVEVRPNVPEAMYDQYREYAEADAGADEGDAGDAG